MKGRYWICLASVAILTASGCERITEYETQGQDSAVAPYPDTNNPQGLSEQSSLGGSHTTMNAGNYIVQGDGTKTADPFWLVLLGGVIGLAGSVSVVAYQTHKAKRVRMDEAIADKKVIANGEAYGVLKMLQASLSQGTYSRSLDFIEDKEPWMIDNRLFLPQDFASNWWTIRAGLRKCVREAGKLEMDTAEKDTPETLATFEGKLQSIVETMLKDVLHEMGHKPADPQTIDRLWFESRPSE